MADRARGEDSIFTLISGGEIVEEFPVQEFTVETIQGVDSQRYVGEQAHRYDETFEGYRISVSGHAEGSSAARGVLRFFNETGKRARRQNVGYKVNASSIIVWSDGEQRKEAFTDLRIENPQYRVSGNDLITFSFTAYCGKKTST